MLKKLLIVAVALLLNVLFINAQDISQTSADDILGNWVSITCELRPGPQYLSRNFTIEEDIWFGFFPNFADPTCDEPTLLFYAEGPYTIGEVSENVDGAIEGVFTITTIRLTPQNENIASFLNSAEVGDCGIEEWQVGIEQDVSETGCSLIGVDLSEPVTEYEVVLVLDDFLFFGARPLDGSGLESPDKRPNALQVPLIRNSE